MYIISIYIFKIKKKRIMQNFVNVTERFLHFSFSLFVCEFACYFHAPSSQNSTTSKKTQKQQNGDFSWDDKSKCRTFLHGTTKKIKHFYKINFMKILQRKKKPLVGCQLWQAYKLTLPQFNTRDTSNFI